MLQDKTSSADPPKAQIHQYPPLQKKEKQFGSKHRTVRVQRAPEDQTQI